MKHLFTVIFFAFLFSFSALAQIDCSNGRYTSEIFPNVIVNSDILYGSAVNVSGQNQDLRLDIYQPEGDNIDQRPLLIIAHGGSFVGGSKDLSDVVDICRTFAKHGYVTASIQYRLGFGSLFPNEELATKAVLRATQDMKAAVRFFRKDAATINNYRIDPDNIVVGGVSAGAFMALHLAYLDKPSEMPSFVNLDEFGGIEGNSGNPGYPSNTKAVVNLCGALGNAQWLEAGDVPLLSMHGNNDNVVPFGNAMLSIAIFPIMVVDGSASIHERATNVGVESTFIPWWNAPHTPFIANAAYMDSVKMHMRPFLARTIGCDVVNVQDLNQRTLFNIYPNPASSNLVIVSDFNESYEIQIIDINGRLVQYERNLSVNESQINISGLQNGIYILRMQTSDGRISQQKFVKSGY
jgi:acetyl esterase/lipase